MGWKNGMEGWKDGSAKPFRTIKTLIGVIDLEGVRSLGAAQDDRSSFTEFHGCEGSDDLQIKINASMLRNAESLRYSNDNSTFSSGRAVS
jgi:hypothetical protein